jgi:hypothetical protein
MQRTYLFFLCFVFVEVWVGAQRIEPIAHSYIVSGGELLRFSLPFEDTTRQVDVFIPTNCKEKKELKVLYMHDGQMLFDSTQTWNKNTTQR